MKRYLGYVMLLVFVLSSCFKSEKESIEELKIHLPTFDKVNLDVAFRKVEDESKNDDSLHAVIHQYYKTVWEKGNVWGGFLIAKGDNVLYEAYRGYSQDNQQDPINSSTPLHVASISKIITSMTVLKLVESRKLNLYDTMECFFPNFPYPNVTVVSLLNQRSGLPKYEYFVDKIQPKPEELQKSFLTNKDILNLLIKYKPEVARKPNTGFMYCNTNYALLALIVEKVTGFSFPDALNEMVFKPLKMNNSYVFQEKDLSVAAKSFYNSGPSVYPYDRLDLIYGDKNVYTTPRDLYNFSKAMYSPNFLDKKLMKLVFEPYSNEKYGINNYGLGFRMKLYENGEKLTYHTGWWHGTNSVFAHLQNSGVTIVSIGNKFSRLPFTALSLAGLFGDYRIEKERLSKLLQGSNSKLSDEALNSSVD